MKRVSIIIIMLLWIMVFLMACSESIVPAETPSLNNSAEIPKTEPLAPSGTESLAPSTATTSTQPQSTVSQSADTATFGDFTVKILKSEVIKDASKKPALRVYFEFTNNSDKNASFVFTISAKAFQNGVELQPAFVMNPIPEDNNIISEIKPGITIKCSQLFSLKDKTPVEMEVSYLFDFEKENILKQIINVNK